MKLLEVVNELCDAIDARHTGCEIAVLDGEVRIMRTFAYAGVRDLRITEVLRAIASPDWKKALAEIEAALKARTASYEERLKLEGQKWVWVCGGTAIQPSGVG
jgi:hypothetical protein